METKYRVNSGKSLTHHPLIEEAIPDLTPDELLLAEHTIRCVAQDLGASQADVRTVLKALGLTVEGDD